MRNLPRKKAGDAKIPRRFNGILLDVREAAQLLGTSEKCVRARVGRRLLPFRKLGYRILFVRSELEKFVESLPGTTLEAALTNVEKRKIL